MHERWHVWFINNVGNGLLLFPFFSWKSVQENWDSESLMQVVGSCEMRWRTTVRRLSHNSECLRRFLYLVGPCPQCILFWSIVFKLLVEFSAYIESNSKTPDFTSIDAQEGYLRLMESFLKTKILSTVYLT